MGTAAQYGQTTDHGTCTRTVSPRIDTPRSRAAQVGLRVKPGWFTDDARLAVDDRVGPLRVPRFDRT